MPFCYTQYVSLFFLFVAGKSKARVITDCRNAIKENNVALLIKVIKTGGAA